jgi:hypothetical protein
MAENEDDVVVPVVSEELHADAIPVETGRVRVTKQVESHEEILEQELRRGRAEVKRVKVDRVVDGPQQIRRSGNTLIIPIVSEVLRVEKQWVITEEIHITQFEERETVQEPVTVNQETARVERLDEQGNLVSSSLDTATGQRTGINRPLARAAAASAGVRKTQQPSSRKVLSNRCVSGVVGRLSGSWPVRQKSQNRVIVEACGTTHHRGQSSRRRNRTVFCRRS